MSAMRALYMNIKGEVVAMLGFAGSALTLWLGMMWAPSVSISAFKAPEDSENLLLACTKCVGCDDRIWFAFCGFNLLVFKRSDWAWRLHVASSEAGLATGLMCVWSGCIWGAAEWGVPWDWTDVRLNTFAILPLSYT